MNDKYIKVADYPNLVRDSVTGAIINTNQTKLKKAIAARNAAIAEKTKINETFKRLDNLQSNLVDIDNSLQNVIGHVDRIDQRLESLQNKLDNINQNLNLVIKALDKALIKL